MAAPPRKFEMPRLLFLPGVFLLIVLAQAQAAPPRTVQAVREGDSITLSNEAISATWSVRGASLHGQSLTNHFNETSLPLAERVFELVPREGPVLRSSDFKIAAAPVIEEAPVSPGSSKAADHSPGRQVRIELEDPSATLLPGAAISGQVKGSPVTAGTWFLGFEHPLSDCRVRADRATCWLSRELPLQAGQSVTYSSVIGVTHSGQLRRDFLNYVELERAHPYRTFLHYNSWYDLGYFDRYNEPAAVAVVQSFGEQLTKERGVKLDSFLFDDGWDDPSTLWKFNPGFPDGLTKVTQTAASFGAAPGIWLSPWGGYDKPKQQRLASAHAQGFETNAGGLALSGPKSYRYFREACLAMIEKYGVNQFKC